MLTQDARRNVGWGQRTGGVILAGEPETICGVRFEGNPVRMNDRVSDSCVSTALYDEYPFFFCFSHLAIPSKSHSSRGCYPPRMVQNRDFSDVAPWEPRIRGRELLCCSCNDPDHLGSAKISISENRVLNTRRTPKDR